MIGRHCIIVAQVGIAGSTQLEDYVTLGGQVGVAGHLRLEKGAMVGAQSGVTRDVIRLDMATLLPVSTDSYEAERHVQHAEWSAYILDAGLPDELFDVRWDAARLTDLGIRSVHGLPLE